MSRRSSPEETKGMSQATATMPGRPSSWAQCSAACRPPMAPSPRTRSPRMVNPRVPYATGSLAIRMTSGTTARTASSTRWMIERPATGAKALSEPYRRFRPPARIAPSGSAAGSSRHTGWRGLVNERVFTGGASNQWQVRRARNANRERSRDGPAGHPGEAGTGGLQRDFAADPRRYHQTSARDRLIGENGQTDGFVDGVVSSYIMDYMDQGSAVVERGRMHPARLPQILPAGKELGKKICEYLEIRQIGGPWSPDRVGRTIQVIQNAAAVLCTMTSFAFS